VKIKSRIIIKKRFGVAALSLSIENRLMIKAENLWLTLPTLILSIRKLQFYSNIVDLKQIQKYRTHTIFVCFLECASGSLEPRTFGRICGTKSLT
jgi:hypothetical protein